MTGVQTCALPICNCFIPFHFREAAANLLTIDEIDPFGKIPEFKFCAVKIGPAHHHRADG